MIRIVKSDDHDEEIAALDLVCFTKQEAYPVEMPSSAECWVALDKDEVVGYLVAHVGVHEGSECHYVDRYGVAPSYAGSGIGKRLLRAWLRWAKQGFAWTYTVADNARSINALINVGFRAWDTDVLRVSPPGTNPRRSFGPLA